MRAQRAKEGRGPPGLEIAADGQPEDRPDPAAAVFGRWYGARTGGSHKSRKTWVGSLACFAVTLPTLWLLPAIGLAAASAGAAMAALIERRAGRLDNLLIPPGVAMLLNLWLP